MELIGDWSNESMISQTESVTRCLPCQRLLHHSEEHATKCARSPWKSSVDPSEATAQSWSLSLPLGRLVTICVICALNDTQDKQVDYEAFLR